MRKIWMVLAGLALCAGLARADVLAQWDAGSGGAGDSTPFTSVTISLGVWAYGDDPSYGDPPAVTFSQVATNSGDVDFTIDSSDPGWTQAMSLLSAGPNCVIGLTESFDDGLSTTNVGSELSIFSSLSELAATPITSIDVDVTNLQFTTETIPHFGTFYNAFYDDGLVTFNDGPEQPPAAPVPAAAGAGATLLAGLGIARLRRKK
jgi:hypothetical protein